MENKGVVLEPSCGPGAFLSKLPKGTIGIEIDKEIAYLNAFIMDFFDYSSKVDTVIGNPPYVRHQDILPQTKAKLNMDLFDNRSNLYLFFIAHSIELLNDGGELIFIVPRDFIKTTSALKLNKKLYEEGGFTFWKEFGDEKVFKDASPNVAIFRWVKGGKHSIPVSFVNGYLFFSKEETKGKRKIYLKDLFDIYVGGASGANDIFVEPTGNIDLVTSETKRTGLTKKAHYVEQPTDYLIQFKQDLLQRKIKKFDENNWWEWGRKIRQIKGDKIYVNNKTRDMKPFFTNDSGWFDGSVLALVPKENNRYSVDELLEILNETNWAEQGFLVGGRLIFGQRSLENAYILV